MNINITFTKADSFSISCRVAEHLNSLHTRTHKCVTTNRFFRTERGTYSLIHTHTLLYFKTIWLFIRILFKSYQLQPMHFLFTRRDCILWSLFCIFLIVIWLYSAHHFLRTLLRYIQNYWISLESILAYLFVILWIQYVLGKSIQLCAWNHFNIHRIK